MTLPDPVTAAEDGRALAELNAWLGSRSAEQRIEWALESLSGGHALSSSFGAQAAVSLHLLSTRKPDIPVILIDTGYMFPETYRFVDELGDAPGPEPARLSPAHQPRLDGSAPWPPVGTGRRRHPALQPAAQGRTDAARA